MNDIAPAPPRAGRTKWTPARQRIFLAALLETGCVTRAAHAAGMARSSANRLRRKLAGKPFDRDWQAVLDMHAAGLADPLRADSTLRRPQPGADAARG
jgi:hypothetical protein